MPSLSDPSTISKPDTRIRLAKRLGIGCGVLLVAGLIFAAGMVTQSILTLSISDSSRETPANGQNSLLSELITCGDDGAGYPFNRSSEAISPASLVAEVGRLSNEKRAEAGLHPLMRSPLLDASAKGKLDHMIEHAYWSHTAPDGTDPWFFVRSAGYRWAHAGENLARDYGSAEGIVDGWMGSTTHRENMLASKYSEMGFAATCVTNRGWMVVAHYGVPE